MKSLAWIQFLAFLPFLFGCGETSQDLRTLEQLEFTVLIEDENLSGMGRLATTDRGMVVVAEPFEPHLRVFSRDGGELLATAVSQGDGPAEVRGVLWLQSLSGRVWGFDQQRMRLLHFLPHELVSDGDGAVEFVALDTEPYLPTVPVVLQDRVLSLTFADTVADRFLRFDHGGAFEGMSPPVASDGEQGPRGLRPAQLFAAGDGRGFMQVGFVELRIRFFDLNGRLIAEARGPGWKPREYVPGVPPQAMTMASQIAYVSVAESNGLVAALASDMKMGDLQPGVMPTANELHLFAWAGKALASYRLPGAFTDVAISQEGQELLLYRATPTPAVLVAPLPVFR